MQKIAGGGDWSSTGGAGFVFVGISAIISGGSLQV